MLLPSRTLLTVNAPLTMKSKFKSIAGTIIPIIDSERRKEYCEREVLSSKQLNRSPLNVHRYTPNNVGDFYAGVHRYFPQLKRSYLDINGFREIKKSKRKSWADKINQHSLIIGGGGLLNIRHFDRQIQLFEQLKDMGKKTVIWGAGHNKGGKGKKDGVHTYNFNPGNFGIVGTRDYGMHGKNIDFVPCVSCLLPELEDAQEPIHEIGVLFCTKSMKNPKLVQKFNEYPNSSNTTNLEVMMNFIKQCDVLITDSYHAMYWAMLMNRKTVVVPTTSKFLDFKYKPVFSSFDHCLNDVSKASSYSGVLEECREINRTFAHKVFDYLEIQH